MSRELKVDEDRICATALCAALPVVGEPYCAACRRPFEADAARRRRAGYSFRTRLILEALEEELRRAHRLYQIVERRVGVACVFDEGGMPVIYGYHETREAAIIAEARRLEILE